MCNLEFKNMINSSKMMDHDSKIPQKHSQISLNYLPTKFVFALSLI